LLQQTIDDCQGANQERESDKLLEDRNQFAILGTVFFNFRAMGNNCVTIVKEREAYIFVYDSESVPALMQMLGRMASDPASNFSQFDAAAASRVVQRLQRAA
jgi:hypothetical protein